jgi:O-antigen/teichoic acid export membrane protein
MESLKKNFLYQTLYQILIVILPLITAPYVARVLGVDNSGVYSFSNTIANYFVVFAMLGLEQYGNRSIAKVRDNQNEMNKVFSELLIVHILVSIVAILFYFIYCFAFTSEYRAIFLLQGFYVVSSLFDVNWFFFGIEKFKLTVTRNTVIKV